MASPSRFLAPLVFLLWPFYSPLLILLTLSLSPIGWQMFLRAFNALICSMACMFVCSANSEHPQASSWHGWSYTETFCKISSALCVSARTGQRKWATHKSHLMKLIKFRWRGEAKPLLFRLRGLILLSRNIPFWSSKSPSFTLSAFFSQKVNIPFCFHVALKGKSI